MSVTFTTSMSLCRCLVTCSTTAWSPSTTNVMRERSGSSLCPTARLEMLNPRLRNMLDTRLSTPGLSLTSAVMVCLDMESVIVIGSPSGAWALP